MTDENIPDYKSYNKAVQEKAIRNRRIDGEIKQNNITFDSELRKQFNIPLKQRVAKNEMFELLNQILITEDKGAQVIETISIIHNKNPLWIKDVSKSNCKKLLSQCLDELGTHRLISLMKKYNVYSKSEIINKKLEVALNKLRKQKQLCLKISKLYDTIEELEQKLITRNVDFSWKEEAVRLRNEDNLSYGKIAKELNKPKSTISSYLNKNCI